MEIIYRGAHLTAEIAATGQLATRGVPVDVPEDVALALIEQDTWDGTESAEQAAARTQGEADLAEQLAAADEAAHAAVESVKAEQTRRRKGGK